jgi:hypothetical protein
MASDVTHVASSNRSSCWLSRNKRPLVTVVGLAASVSCAVGTLLGTNGSYAAQGAFQPIFATASYSIMVISDYTKMPDLRCWRHTCTLLARMAFGAAYGCAAAAASTVSPGYGVLAILAGQAAGVGWDLAHPKPQPQVDRAPLLEP